jgi:hypothetical protein
VDSTIQEAVALQALAKASNLEIPESTESLIKAAEKQNEERQTEQAFFLADEAVLQIHLSMLKQEQKTLAAENKKISDSVSVAKESLEIYRSILKERITAPKEHLIN